jgi:CRISPR system Cascade subunit CasB
MSDDRTGDPFITYLHDLREERNLGALATLRRGLGRPIGAVPEMFRYIVPRLPRNMSSWDERVYYTVASLFAMHPSPGGHGNIGYTLNELERATGQSGGEGVSSVERRLLTLLKSDTETLSEHLRQVISLASSKDLPIDWDALLWDLKGWNREDRGVQKRWAESFWSKEEEE